MFAWSGLINKVRDVTPVLGSIIAKSNPLADVAINMISQAFGANSKDPQDILDKINADPEYQLKLKKIEYDHQDVLVKANTDDYKTEVDDRKSARQMNEETHSFIPTFLAIGYFLTYSIIQAYCLMYPAETNDIISARLHDGFMFVLAYFFGSSHRKDTISQNKY